MPQAAITIFTQRVSFSVPVFIHFQPCKLTLRARFSQLYALSGRSFGLSWPFSAVEAPSPACTGAVLHSRKTSHFANYQARTAA